MAVFNVFWLCRLCPFTFIAMYLGVSCSCTSIFEICSNIKFNKKMCSVGAELFDEDGQTDRHEEANSCFSQFSERA